MSYRVHIITVLACIGMGIAPQFAAAASPNSGKDLWSIMCSYKNPVVNNDGETGGASAVHNHRLARTYADQNDIQKADTCFGLALQNAAPKQIPMIASDYAVFLLNTGDLHKAELILKQAHSQSPDDTGLTKMLARCLVQQEKMVEGLRYFRSVYSEAEAQQAIAAIYREQGNTDMLAVVDKKWGSAKLEHLRAEPMAPATQPRSGAVWLDSKVPIPDPAPQPLAAMAGLPKQATVAKVPVPLLPAPMPMAVQKPALKNPVKLATAPLSSLSVLLTEDRKSPNSAVTVQPRRHYAVSTGNAANLGTFLPIKPTAATIPVR